MALVDTLVTCSLVVKLKLGTHMLRQCSRVPWTRLAARNGFRGFAAAKGTARWSVRPLAIGTAAGAYATYRVWTAANRSEEEIELPAVPEPEAHFKHPYETWPWYQKAWFAFKRSVPWVSWANIWHLMVLKVLLLGKGCKSACCRCFWPGSSRPSCVRHLATQVANKSYHWLQGIIKDQLPNKSLG